VRVLQAHSSYGDGVPELDISLPGARTLHLYDDGAPDAEIVVFWHHGTPQNGVLPGPLVELARRTGVRLISQDRPGYGTSTAHTGRSVADVAGDVAQVADRLGIDTFAVLGESGGGPHALACAALLPERVTAVACVATIAPFDAAGLDWFAGMSPSNAEEFEAARRGRDALESYGAAHADPDLDAFVPADLPVLAGPYQEWFVASSQGVLPSEGYVDDGLAFVRDWGFDPASIRAPLLLVHGSDDRFVPCAHARWLARTCPGSELRVEQGGGHLSVMASLGSVLGWLAVSGSGEPRTSPRAG
jgi:pimeloyl-ACP methyl ester carboxylesterase